MTSVNRCAAVDAGAPGEVWTERVRFDCAGRVLVGELAYGVGALAFACLLLNPHPLMGGTIDNNVVRTLASGLAARGCVTLRFDYSGVGDSAGPRADVAAAMAQFWETGGAPHDPLMAEDGAGAMRYLRQTSSLPIVVIGYSFGAFVASQIVDERTAGAIVISPTLRHHNLSRLAEFRGPRLVIYSDNDFATPRDLTEPWISGLPGDVGVACIARGEHFFRNFEGQVVRACESFIDRLPRKEPS